MWTSLSGDMLGNRHVDAQGMGEDFEAVVARNGREGMPAASAVGTASAVGADTATTMARPSPLLSAPSRPRHG
jgi:hypothetical protein